MLPSEFSYTVYEENLIFFSISVVDDNYNILYLLMKMMIKLIVIMIMLPDDFVKTTAGEWCLDLKCTNFYSA